MQSSASPSPNTQSFSGKVALITGASSGIGESIAKALAAGGAKVVINGRDEGRLTAVQADITKAGGTASIHIGDVRHEKTHQELVELAVKEYGALHIAINNAGMAHFEPLVKMSGEHIDDVVDINLKSTLYGMKHQINTIGQFTTAEEWGHIINISSSASKVSLSIADGGGLVYSVTKAAINQATRLGASEGRHRRVLVNCISPGPIFTPIFKQMGATDQAGADKIGDRMNLLGRAGTVDDTTVLTLFLLGKGGSYINGAVVPVDGGMGVK